MGLDYGINNKSGIISLEDSHQILFKAYISGIKTLDTAEVYGNAHKVIGEFHRNYPDFKFNIITKLPHNIKKNRIKINIKEYLEDLELNFIEVLMFHSFDSFKNNQFAVDTLLELKAKGLIKNIGVSVYTNDQLEYLLDKDYIKVVQLPFNLLDNYSVRGNLLEALKLKGKIIHTRSAFLQGLFFKKTNDETSVVKRLSMELEILNQIALESNCSIDELALAFCLSQKNIDSVIIGVDSLDHLNTNIKASLYKIEEVTVQKINSIKVNDLNLLNPSLW
jgi:aryl-alcohol dehydrogenase-like predicted oxidoreductase